MNKNVRIAKQLIKLAKSLIADVQVDQTEHKLDQLKLWIKNGFKEEACKLLAKLEINKGLIKKIINDAEFKASSVSFGKIDEFTNQSKDLVLKKSFMVKDQEIVNAVKEVETVNDGKSYMAVNVEGEMVYFEFNVVMENYMPLFRSCTEINYDQKKGDVDKKGLEKINNMLKEAYDSLGLK